jgi:hypothetical protein
MIHRSHRIQPVVAATPAFAHEPSDWGALRRTDFAGMPPWVGTRPLGLQPDRGAATPHAFDEPIRGLQVREIDSATLFGHLFA